MSKKKDAPPRPPAPKLTLSKVGGRQGSVGSISVHYSPSMDDSNGDMDKDIVFDPETSSDVSPVPIKSKPWNMQQQQQSRSAPSSEATTPVFANQKLIGQSSLDQGLLRPTQDIVQFRDGNEKSLLSGLREKLNDLPNAFIGKIEEFSSDTVFADIVDRKLKKSDSMDSSRSFGGGTSALDMAAVQATDLRKTPTSTPGGVAIEEPTDAQPVQNTGRRTVYVTNDTSDSQEVETETFECHHKIDVATSGTTHLPTVSSRDRMFPSKMNDDKIPMTLSGLLLTRDDSVDDIPSSESENTFYDADDLPPTPTAAKEKPKTPTISRQDYTWHILPIQKIVTAVVCVLAYLVVPLPSFVSGLLSGVTLTFCIIKLHQFMTQPSRPKEPFVIPNLDTLPPMRMPETHESKNEDGKFKGWMNEVSHYDLNEYRINQSHSIFVQLEGTKLRLQRAHSRVPKRAMWNESQRGTITFSPHQRFLNLTDAKVSLLPKGIVCKRLWSKKYPILIELVASLQDSPSFDDLGEPNVSAEDLNVDNSDPAVRRLYLFARTPREKEEWYWRFFSAASGLPLPTKMAGLLTKLQTSRSRGPSLTSIDSITKKRIDSNDSDSESIPLDVPSNEDGLLAYMQYMAHVMPMRQHGIPGPGKGLRLCEPNLLFLNAFIARFFWDFLREKFWAGKIQTKIQKKLSKIHVPYFIDELTVTGIEIGSEMPIIRRSTQPFLNDRGLWSDLDITYNGGFRMSLETKVNLMKLKKMSSGSSFVVESNTRKNNKGLAVMNSDEEDSGESSTDEEGSLEEKPTAETPDDKAGGKGKKLLRFVDKITQSKYFQQVAEYKYIRKAMEEVSNTRLVLTVELKSLSGTLAINIPPPPTDRVWYGFRTNPRLWLSAKPRVGQREVNVSHITDWIEKKLAVEFQRVFVMPNMDDLVIPLMCSHMADCQTKFQTDKTTAAR